MIGVLQHHVPIAQAFASYTIMSIGDGLVSQIPALVISIAAGFLVSKSGVEGSADKALVAQLAMSPISLGMVAAAAGVPTRKIFLATLLPNLLVAAIYSVAADNSFVTACITFFATLIASALLWWMVTRRQRLASGQITSRTITRTAPKT